jgi:hypothetical protein
MAFKIGNKTVLHDADPSATLLTNSNLDKLQINGIDVLTHDGTTVTLQNVDIPTQIATNASLTTSINTNTSNIAINTTAISNNATAITNNATAITNNATAISNNATAITNNETAINNNVTAIANTLVDAKSYTDTRETAITAVINALTTDDVPESGSPTNVYFTNARVDTALGSVNADIIPASSETHNLGSATARWNKLFLKGSSIDLGGVDISASGTGMSVGGSDMASKTYTDQAEADANTYTDTAIANLVDTAPTTLDTLNELASALGDDANFSTTVTTSIATKLATADFTSTADTWLGTKDTGDIAEGSNLYYTDVRVDARISSAGSQPLTSVSDSAPASPVSGQMWWNSATGRLKIYYSDGDSSQWVDVTPSMGNILSTTLSQVREEIAKEMSPKQLIISETVSANDANTKTVNLDSETQYIVIIDRNFNEGQSNHDGIIYWDLDQAPNPGNYTQMQGIETKRHFFKIPTSASTFQFKRATNNSLDVIVEQYKD